MARSGCDRRLAVQAVSKHLAVLEDAGLARYWQMGPAGVDPQVGAPVKWDMGAEVRDLGQVVLESEPYRRLSCSWHTYQREWSEMFGWTQERSAELVKEGLSKVTFDLEPAGSSVKLTVTHDDFEPGSETLKAVSVRQ